MNKRPYKRDNENSGAGKRPAYKKDAENGAGRDGRSERPYKKTSGDDKPYGRKPYSGRDNDTERKPYGERTGSTRPYGTRDTTDRPASRSKFNSGGDADNRKPYGRSTDGDRPAYKSRSGSEGGERKAYGERGDSKPFGRKAEGGERPYSKRTERSGDDRKPFGDRTERKPFGQREQAPYKPRFNKEEGREERKPFEARGERTERRTFGSDTERKPYVRREAGDENREKRTYGSSAERKPYGKRADADKPAFRKRDAGDSPYKKPFQRTDRREEHASRKEDSFRKAFREDDDYETEAPKSKERRSEAEKKGEPMTLNKYLAHSGVSSRRDAGAIIKGGKVMVNGKVHTAPGYRVQPGDIVTMDDKTLKPQRNLVYILLNKPKDFLTTTEDDRGRRTVMELVNNAEVEGRIYPVGRLDRNTTGILLLTNDGDLAQKLSHPSYEVKKIYQVSLDKNLTKPDFDAIVKGVELEDGVAPVDQLAYLDAKSEIGIEIHSGRNRIVRRIFEHLGYKVEKLDRVVYAGLTKKNVARGKWRFLSEREVVLLKHFKAR